MRRYSTAVSAIHKLIYFHTYLNILNQHVAFTLGNGANLVNEPFDLRTTSAKTKKYKRIGSKATLVIWTMKLLESWTYEYYAEIF